MTVKNFFFKLLSGSAQGILIGVLPSAVMKYILQYSGLLHTSLGSDFNAILTLFTSLIPLLIGVAVALQFQMKSLDVGVVGLATMVASGAIKWVSLPAGALHPVTGKTVAAATPLYVASGAGDVINAMCVAALAVLVTWAIAKYANGFGAVAIIFSPIVVGGGVGLIGKTIAPYVANVTNGIGQLVNLATQFAPVPMAILIAMAFAVLIVTPISTVGIALAIHLSGIGAAASGVGIVATTLVLIINSWQTNKKGVTIAIFLGAMKGMMPSVFARPIMLVSFMFAGALSSLPVALWHVEGTEVTAGFGYIGMVSPIQSMVPGAQISHVISGAVGLLTWFVIPLASAYLAQLIFSRWLKWYQPSDLQQEL